ncbi:MAG: phosphonate ABC transporter, permease protein PhnE [Gammaproteobacteria bacterium]|nr:phosphonate ABC transporter, permease protein PhnE [Gammaproteobacteria bacterium]
MNAIVADRPTQAFRAGVGARLAALAILLYALYAIFQLDFSWARFVTGLDNGAKFLGRMFPPDVSKLDILWSGIRESLQIAVLASAAGIIISLPIGLLGARNLMPAGVTWTARALVVLCRSLHPVIVAILFVKAVGFGALAGVLSLMVATVGFIGKLFAEAIEEISAKQVEAVRATGASFMNVILFGVLPQVLPRFVGFSTYQLDSNLRNSTMVGIVGAGGVGGALFAAFQRFDYDFVFTILATIVALVFIGEVLVNAVKKVFHV